MKKKIAAMILTVALVAASLAGCGTQKADTAQETTVTLFAAKSLNTVMEELIAAYQEKHPNVKIVGSYDSSGTLMTQIEEGAACDIFFSAAQKQMNQLEQDGLLVDETRHKDRKSVV